MTLRSSQAQRVRMRAYLLARDGRGCARCGDPIDARETPSIGHVLALAHGGTDEPRNLRLEHLACNVDAGADGDRARVVEAGFSIEAGPSDRPLRLVKRCPNPANNRTTVRFRLIAPEAPGSTETAGDARRG